MGNGRQKRLKASALALHEEQSNILAAFERDREIVELPESLVNGHVARRKRGARTDEDCINEICELISRGILGTVATEFVGVPWSTWHAWIRRNHCRAKELHDIAYEFHLEAMADKIHRVYLELKAKREMCMQDYYRRRREWVDSVGSLEKGKRAPIEPVYEGPAEWELKAAEDQVKAWQWHLEMRHDKFKKTQAEHVVRGEVTVSHELNLKRDPQLAMREYLKLIDVRPNDD